MGFTYTGGMERLCLSIWFIIVVRVCFSLRVFTPDIQSYVFPLARKGFTVKNITQLRFKLRACTDGHLILQKDDVVDMFTEGSWTFVVGAAKNRRGDIRTAVYGRKSSMHYEALLDCNEFRPFWIRWKGGLLELGKGSEFGINRICVHTTTPIGFNYAFVLTGWGSTGCWDIDAPSNSILATSWTKLSGNKKLEGSNVTSHHARSQFDCGAKCMTPTEDLPCGCVEYSYNKLTKQCLVVDESETSTIVPATGWGTWQLM